MNFVMYSFSGAALTGMGVSPGWPFNSLSTQGLLLTMDTQYVGNSCLDHTLWEGVPEGTWRYHIFSFVKRYKLPKVSGRLGALAHWEGSSVIILSPGDK